MGSFSEQRNFLEKSIIYVKGLNESEKEKQSQVNEDTTVKVDESQSGQATKYTSPAAQNSSIRDGGNIVAGVEGLAQALYIGKTKAAQIASSGILEQNKIGYYAGYKHLYHKDRLLKFIEENPNALRHINANTLKK